MCLQADMTNSIKRRRKTWVTLKGLYNTSEMKQRRSVRQFHEMNVLPYLTLLQERSLWKYARTSHVKNATRQLRRSPLTRRSKNVIPSMSEL